MKIGRVNDGKNEGGKEKNEEDGGRQERRGRGYEFRNMNTDERCVGEIQEVGGAL